MAGADAVLRLTLAAICAAALAVHEAFGIFAITPGRDDGYRSIALNLWDLDAGVTDGPPLQWVPAAWWLVGLGHLGQANAWVLAWLGLPTGTEITLQDDGVLSDANHSTGILTPEHPALERKTRQAARSLEAAESMANVAFATTGQGDKVTQYVEPEPTPFQKAIIEGATNAY